MCLCHALFHSSGFDLHDMQSVSHSLTFEHIAKIFIPPAIPPKLWSSLFPSPILLARYQSSLSSCFTMSLPLRSLSLNAILEPLFQLHQLVTELRMIRSSSHPEVSEYIQAISAQLDVTIHFYESRLQIGMATAWNLLRVYMNHTWDVPPLRGPERSSP